MSVLNMLFCVGVNINALKYWNKEPIILFMTDKQKNYENVSFFFLKIIFSN